MVDWDVVVVGAGPAGLVAASGAEERGRHALLLEKNGAAGAKILVSGGGRCNLTHATDPQGIVEAFGPAGRFLYSALGRLGPQELIALIEAEGVATQVEPDGKVFPRSDRAADVLAALLARLHRSGATVALDEPVLELERHGNGFRLVTGRRTMTAHRVVLATGGKSYPGCGTTGDGYRWAAELGHTIVEPRPALVPVTTDAAWLKDLRGITIPDVRVRVVAVDVGQPNGGRSRKQGKPLAEGRGSLLFAHFGLSGPVVLDLSRLVSARPRGKRPLLLLDFLPEVSQSQLDAMLAEAAHQSGRRRVARLLDRWLPNRLGETLVAQAALDGQRTAAELSREDRLRLVRAVKQLAIPATGTLGFEKAEVTAGGVDLAEIDPRTMQSKRVPGLFVVGELLDLDGPVGGYNLQAAISTGHLAGQCA